MSSRPVLVMVCISLTAARLDAQPVPELPQPRPVVPGQPLPELPRPRPLPPPVPPLVRQALESNQYKPVCEPEPPTHGVWGASVYVHGRSWQEWRISSRDCLAWIFTRPKCAQGMRPPRDASLFDWVCDHLPFHTSAVAAHGTQPPIRVIPAPPAMPAN